MQAVVLVGGKGTRLRPLTRATPKPLLPVAGRPLIAHLLERLPEEVDEVVLAVSYMADAVAAWARAREDPAISARRVVIVEEDPPLGTGGALANLSERVSGPLVVMNGDLVSDLDVGGLVARHRALGRAGTMALVRVAEPSRYGVVDQGADGRVRRFVEKPAPGTEPSDLVNAGAYVLEEEVVASIPSGSVVSLERDVFPALAERGELAGFVHKGLWLDCGTPQSYLEANHALRERAGVDVLHLPGSEVDASARVSRSVLGRSARVAAGARVEGSVLHERAIVHADAHVVDSVIGSRAEVPAGAVLRDAVLGPGERPNATEAHREE